MTSGPHLSAATAAADHVDVAWDRGNDQWWDWYMSLADGPAAAGPPVDGRAPYAGPLPTDDEVAAELATPYPLDRAAADLFAAGSYVTLPGVLSPGTAARLRELLDAAVDPAVGFQSLGVMWLTDPLVRAAVLPPRATTYSADGARVVPAPTMISGDWQKFVPGTGPGEVAASGRNPVVG